MNSCKETQGTMKYTRKNTQPALPEADIKLQRRTIATMLQHIKLYNAGIRGAIEEKMEAAVPMLIKLGLYDVFTSAEWINGSNEGRRFVGETARKYAEEHSRIILPRFLSI
jgi:hypothetical protein